MGLAIDVCTGIKHIGNFLTYQDWRNSELYNDDYLYIDNDMPLRLDGSDMVICGVYSVIVKYRFRAGSYSGYNKWRDWLSELMLNVPANVVWQKQDLYRDKPFYNLVCFSDCEGIIGGNAARQLYADFNKWQNIIGEFKHDWFMQDYVDLYLRFLRAFEIASDNGIVRFV